MRLPGLMAVAVATTVWASTPAPVLKDSVMVCVEVGSDGWIRSTAEPLASRVFAGIGVRIDWGPDTPACWSKQGAIKVHLSYSTPPSRAPRAWASSYPYGSSDIVVFYDRVNDTIRTRRSTRLLTYVLVHEITHVLQGVARHSEDGIMKAAWGDDDFFEMSRDRLEFNPLDVLLIYQGLESRNAGLVASRLPLAGLP
jgi:hypothetical protein